VTPAPIVVAAKQRGRVCAVLVRSAPGSRSRAAVASA